MIVIVSFIRMFYWSVLQFNFREYSVWWIYYTINFLLDIIIPWRKLKNWPVKILLKAIMKIKNINQTLINASNRINETHMVWIQDQNCRLIFMIIKRILHSWSVLCKFIFWKEKCNVECIKCSLQRWEFCHSKDFLQIKICKIGLFLRWIHKIWSHNIEMDFFIFRPLYNHIEKVIYIDVWKHLPNKVLIFHVPTKQFLPSLILQDL